MILPRRKSSLPSTDAGDRIYAVGDVHGRFDLMQALMEKIAQHHADLPPTQGLHIIFLGDLIDRGPDSLKVLDYLAQAQRRMPGMIVLLGNHEEVLLKVLEGDQRALRSWLTFGGAQTLESMGVAVPGPDDDLDDCLTAIRRALPMQLASWLRRLPLTAHSGDYFFCHAGVRPGVPLKRQKREDLLWIRDDFLTDQSGHGAVIVHGHSIHPQVDMHANRIGIDTGAYATGVLTALYLEGDRREVLQVG
ncbi:metallophosphoesterase family protein [Novosphingobium terrae]|uniref:metallophosphoesterase family protein n=1 Tax=Novosphingobium terrae TaxID=2726189 RepID=UPI00197F4165|nr:metallophosphoesterase family protein [Novosphingobium terrae]